MTADAILTTQGLTKRFGGLVAVDGIDITPLIEGGEVIERLGDRVLGRVALEDISDPFTSEILVHANEEIDEEKVDKLEAAGHRVIGLQHFFDNGLGGSLHGLSNRGLTDFGRDVVTEAIAGG